LSQLQKKINSIGRREGGVGFNRAIQEKPRAMLLGTIAADAASAKKGLDSGADVVIIRAADAAAAAKAIADVGSTKACIGVQVPALDDAGAEALRKAGCDFVISPLESTSSIAVDSERMGHVVALPEAIDDTTLRALGPLGLDGLFVDKLDGTLTLASQINMVRLASFSSTPLLGTVAVKAPVAELRVLRDSGVAVVVAPEGTSAADLAKLAESLKSVPPKKSRHDGGDIAMIPAGRPAAEESEDDDDDDDDE
jgi:2-keto-3-deoxy-L-rhamnonate aldolase RhmA